MAGSSSSAYLPTPENSLPAVSNRKIWLRWLVLVLLNFFSGVAERSGVSFEDIFEQYPNAGTRISGNTFANPDDSSERGRNSSATQCRREIQCHSGARSFRGSGNQMADSSFFRVKKNYNCLMKFLPA